MFIKKFHKVPELFPNCKVRTVRTEQLCFQSCTKNTDWQQYPIILDTLLIRVSTVFSTISAAFKGILLPAKAGPSGWLSRNP